MSICHAWVTNGQVTPYSKLLLGAKPGNWSNRVIIMSKSLNKIFFPNSFCLKLKESENCKNRDHECDFCSLKEK